MTTYYTDKVLVSHLLYGDVVHETRYHCPWARLLTKVDLLQHAVIQQVATKQRRSAHLDIQAICVGVLFDCTLSLS